MTRDPKLTLLGMDRVSRVLAARPSRGGLRPIDVGIGESGFDPGPYLDRDALHLHVEAVRAYGDPSGEPLLRRRLADVLARVLAVSVSADSIVITNGASGALAATLFALVSPGDEVVLPRIHYPAYRTLVAMAGARCRYADVGQDGTVTADSIRSVSSTKTRAVILNSPSNPMGTRLSRSQLIEIAELGFPVISDEVYMMLGGADSDAASMLQVSSAHYVVGSFSKAYAAAGLRVGFVVTPARQTRAIIAAHTAVNLCVAIPSQKIASTVLGHHDAIVQAHNQHLRHNRRAFIERVRELGLPLWAEPRHGPYGLIDISRLHRKSIDVALELASDVGVATAPGADFAEHDVPFLRLNYNAALDDVLEAVARIAAQVDLRKARASSDPSRPPSPEHGP